MFNNIITLDLESRSFVDLPKSNAWIYSKHPSTDILCMAWKELNGDKVYEWSPGDRALEGFFTYDKNTKVVAHNALFEYVMFKHILIPRYRFPKWLLNPENWICTQGLAYSAGLPGKLDDVAKFLNLKHQKLDTGSRLINLYSKPVKDKATGELSFRKMPPDDFDNMKEYNRVDVLATEETYLKVGKLPNVEIERKLWVLDFKQNIQGVPVDLDTMKLLQKALNKEKIICENRMNEIGVNVRSGPQMKKHFAEFDYKLPNIQIETVERMEKIVTEPELLELLKLRKFLSKASVKKYDALDNRTDDEAVLKLPVRYHKAHTGRWAGAGFQIHNLPRMNKKESDIFKAIEKIQTGDYTLDTLIEYAKIILPGLIKAKEGHVFIKGDYSAIEARVEAFLVGQLNLINAFINDEPVYERMGSLIFNVLVESIGKKDLARQVGKQAVLGCGYGMGADKFKATCEKYNIIVSQEIAEKAKTTFRTEYPKIKKFWYDLQDAFKLVWKNGGRSTVKVGNYLLVTGTKGCIRVVLPSGRSLYYHQVKYHEGQLSFFSPEKKKRIDIWGGLLAENVTQAVARDILGECMLALDRACLNPIMHVHDEAICYVHEKESLYGGFETFDKIMNTPPVWFKGFPLKTESEVCRRYFK